MMMTKLKKMGLAAAACMLLGTNAAEAAVTLYFYQDGADVKAEWRGSFWVPGGSGGGGPQAAIGSSYVLGLAGNYAVNSPANGTAETTSLVSGSGTYVGDSFGFFGASGLYFDFSKAHTLYSPVGTFTFADTTLAALGADSFNNTLAYTGNSYFWQSNFGQPSDGQIFYQTGAPPAVPEPSVASFGLLGLSAILLQRRRKGKAGSDNSLLTGAEPRAV